MVEQYYREEMQFVKSRPLWPKFDAPMRVALEYMARERAKRRAKKEMKDNHDSR